MVKWHNSGIIILIIGFFNIHSEIYSRYDNLEVDWLLLAQLECNTIQSHCEYLMTYSRLRKYSWNVPRGWRGRGGGDSLKWPIRGGFAQKEYLIWASCIQEGRDLQAVGKSIILVCKKSPNKVNKCILWLWKSKKKKRYFVIYS